MAGQSAILCWLRAVQVFRGFSSDAIVMEVVVREEKGG